jgi:hypothetical protein
MRKALVARLFFATTILSAAGVWIACGGSDSQDVTTTPDAGKDTGAPDKDTGPVDDDSGGPEDSGPKDTGADVKVYDAGPPIYLDGGDIDGGVLCVVGGELEQEDNNTAATANPINYGAVPGKASRCGVIKIDAQDAGESDFLKFELADAATKFYLQYAGDVHVIVETDGSAPVDITQDSSELAFRKGQPYLVEVKSKDGKQQVWRVTLFQE